MALVLGTNCGLVSVTPTEDPNGSVTANADLSKRALKITVENRMFITGIGWWCEQNTQEANFEVGVYDHDADNDKPGNRLYLKDTNAKGTTSGWKGASVSNWELQPGTYWIAFQLDDTATTTNTNSGAINGQRYVFNLTGITSLPNPFGTCEAGAANSALAIYATYVYRISPFPTHYRT
jgi:hypothetical protein